MADLQSVDVPLELSADGGTTWLKIVCRSQSGFDSSVEVSKEKTDCGVKTSVSDPEWTFDFTATTNTAPSATEASAKMIHGWHNAKTLVQVRQQDGTTGANSFKSGSCYITNYKETYATGKVVIFNGTLTGDGALDIAP